MGASIVIIESNVWSMFGPFSENLTRFFASVRGHRWDIDPLLYLRDKRAVKAIETYRYSTPNYEGFKVG